MTTQRVSAVLIAALALLATIGVVPAAAVTTSAGRLTTSAVTSPDYCGGTGRSAIVPERWYRADWTSACDDHDTCYASSSTRSRLDCDKTMLVAMKSECRTAYNTSPYRRPLMYQLCLTRARDYYVGLRLSAKKYYLGSGSRA